MFDHVDSYILASVLKLGSEDGGITKVSNY